MNGRDGRTVRVFVSQPNLMAVLTTWCIQEISCVWTSSFPEFSIYSLCMGQISSLQTVKSAMFTLWQYIGHINFIIKYWVSIVFNNKYLFCVKLRWSFGRSGLVYFLIPLLQNRKYVIWESLVFSITKDKIKVLFE